MLVEVFTRSTKVKSASRSILASLYYLGKPNLSVFSSVKWRNEYLSCSHPGLCESHISDDCFVNQMALNTHWFFNVNVVLVGGHLCGSADLYFGIVSGPGGRAEGRA